MTLSDERSQFNLGPTKESEINVFFFSLTMSILNHDFDTT